MGTPLPEIITLPGIECSVCPESGGPFPDGPTPLNPVMIFSDFSHGDLWDDAFDPELQAGQEVQQSIIPCGWAALSANFTWFFRFDQSVPIVSIIKTSAPLESPFTTADPLFCQVQYQNAIVLPAGVIAFGGVVSITWGDIV